MSADLISLRALENLVQEFYISGTTNVRKYEIERILQSFSEHSNACHSCIFYISNTRDEYVLMYCFGILEAHISKRWQKIPDEERISIRDLIYQMLLSCNSAVSAYIRNKLAKLLVLIARNDWPNQYPDFFKDIAKLICDPLTVQLAFLLLQIASEELAFPKDSLHSTRKADLRKLMDSQMPEFLNIIISILSSYKLEFNINEHMPHNATKLPFAKKSALRNAGSSNSCIRPRKKSQTLDDNSSTCVSLLTCLNHLVTWIDLSRCTNMDHLLLYLFQIVRLNQENVSELGLSCIIELLASPTFLVAHSNLVIITFQYLCAILSEFVSNEDELMYLNDSFSIRLCEFINVFLKNFLKRIESSNQPSIQIFLEIFFKFTFNQKSIDVFPSALSVWNQFIDSAFFESNRQNDISQLQKYEEILKLLAENILRKIQFKFNQSQLEALDDDILDDDFKTEWQLFLTECIELIAKVGEISLQYVFSITIPPMQDALVTYNGSEQYISYDPNQPACSHLKINSETDCSKLHCALRDLTTFLQLHGRLFDILTSHKFEDTTYEGYQLVHKLVECLQYGAKIQFFKLKSTPEGILQTDFVDVLSNSISSVKACSTWLQNFYLKSRTNENDRILCDNLICTIIESIVPMYYGEQLPEKIQLSVSNLLLSISTNIRPTNLLDIPVFQILYDRGINGASLPPQSEFFTYRALSNYLILPWSGILPQSDEEQKWDMRTEKHRIFISKIVDSCKEVNQTNINQFGISAFEHCLSIISDLVSNLQSNAILKSKVIFYKSVTPFFEHMVNVFPSSLKNPVLASKILEYFLAMVSTLSSQMTFNIVNQFIQNLLHLFTSELIMESLHIDESAGHSLVDMFLQILIVVVQESGALFKTSIPCLLNLTLHHIYPILAQRPIVDVKPSLFKLLYEILKNHWRLFFRSEVLTIANNRIKQLESQTSIEGNHSQVTCDLYNGYLILILQAYGQSFLQPDIDLFKSNLQYMEQLHLQYKLYNKDIFKEKMISQMITVLLHVLIQKSHDILKEEIATSIFNMAAIDFKVFKEDCIRRFLMDSDQLNNEQRANLHAILIHEDLPSFTCSIHQFVNDFIYYRNLNHT